MKKYFKALILLPLILIFEQCSDNPASGNHAIFYKDSVYSIQNDTSIIVISEFVPIWTGNVNSDMKLDFDAQTNLDSVIGFPHLMIRLTDSNYNNLLSYESYSKIEINGHHSLILNTKMVQPFKLSGYKLFFNVYVSHPHTMAYKSIVARNISLVPY